jgi:predicted metal-dependent peptidase
MSKILSKISASIALERTLFQMTYDKGDEGLVFIGAVLQCMNIKFDPTCPTAAIRFNSKLKQFELIINADFFLSMSEKERVSILVHELYHVLHKHVFIPPELVKTMNPMILNCAFDLTINQLIKNLPDQAMFIERFKTKDGKPFPRNETYEMYYSLLMNSDFNKNFKQQKGKEQEGNQSSPISGSGNGDSKSKDNDQEGQDSKNKEEWVDTKEYFSQQQGTSPFDDHEWGEGEELREKLDAASELVKRTLQKSVFNFSKSPKFIQDFLDEVSTQIKKLDYKSILLKALRQSLPSKDIKKTWKRLSRRYGDLAKGNITGLMPKLRVYIDTSGSISTEEANEFFKITNNFLTVGAQKAYLHLFHTELYHEEKIKRNFKLKDESMQSGGTDLQPAMDHISKYKPDLAIIITDGYYDLPDLKKITTPVVFIISKNGNKDHCMKHIGTTVTYA